MGNELASCVFTEGLIDLGPRARPPPPQPELWAPGGDGLVFSRLVFKVKCLL